jgi:hypothetical protein
MASIIRIKRSLTAGDPSVLAAGELAYSAADYNTISGGGRLYIGIGTESNGDAASHLVIGGKYFTDKLDHAPGTLTASSALIVDADKKLDELLVDDLSLNGSTVSTIGENNLILRSGSNLIQLAANNYMAGGNQDGSQLHFTNSSVELKQLRTGQVKLVVGDGGTESHAVILNNSGALTVPGTITTQNDANLVLNPSGAVSIKGAYTLPSSDGSPGYALTTDGFGSVTFQQTSGSLSIGADTGSGTITLLSETFSVLGGTGISTNSFGNDITVTLENTEVSAGTYGSATKSVSFTVDAQGRLTAASENDIASTLNFNGNTGTGSIDLLSENLQIVGEGAITTGVFDDILYISVAQATDTVSGVANFNATDFNVDIGGQVSIRNVNLGSQTFGNYVQTIADAGNSNITVNNSGTASADVSLDLTDTTVTAGTYGDGSNIPTFTVDSKGRITSASTVSLVSDITIGTTSISLGDSSTTLEGLTEVTVGDITISGNVITAPGNIVLQAVFFDEVTEETTQYVVDVAGSRITEVGDPLGSYDAANKRYVDNIAAGLTIKPAVKVATTADLGAVYDNGASGVGSTLTIPATATLTIDGVSVGEFDSILVKDQINAEENGRYYISTLGDSTTAWVLTRCSKCDESFEIPSMYVFVQEGTLYNSTGWVASVDTLPVVVGTSDITFIQFSGAGTFLAGEGLSLNGNEFSVNVGDGIVLEAGDVTLASTVAGDGLTYTNGVLDIGGTADRIAVNADSIDIASTYVGQSSITTLGTITTGTWNGTTIGVAYGGTGLASYTYGDLLVGDVAGGLSALTVGSTGKVLQSNGNTVVYGDVDGGTY